MGVIDRVGFGLFRRGLATEQLETVASGPLSLSAQPGQGPPELQVFSRTACQRALELKMKLSELDQFVTAAQQCCDFGLPVLPLVAKVT